VDFYSPSIAKAEFYLFCLMIRKWSILLWQVTSQCSQTHWSILGWILAVTWIFQIKHYRPPSSKVFLGWDLSLVLWTLSEPLFEPMFVDSKVSMHFVT